MLEKFLADCKTPVDKSNVKPPELLDTLYSINEAILFMICSIVGKSSKTLLQICFFIMAIIL